MVGARRAPRCGVSSFLSFAFDSLPHSSCRPSLCPLASGAVRLAPSELRVGGSKAATTPTAPAHGAARPELPCRTGLLRASLEAPR